MGQIILSHHSNEKTGGQIRFDGTMNDDPIYSVQPGPGPIVPTDYAPFGMNSTHHSSILENKDGLLVQPKRVQLSVDHGICSKAT